MRKTKKEQIEPQPTDERTYSPFEISFRNAFMTTMAENREKQKRAEHEKNCAECQNRDQIRQFHSEVVKLQMELFSKKPKPEVPENSSK